MLQAFVMILAPLLLTWGAKRFSWIENIGTVILAYGLGIFLGNGSLIIDTNVSKTIVEAAVPLSIGLLLLSSNIKQWIKSAQKTILSFFLCLFAVTIGAIFAFLLFNDVLPSSPYLAGMSIGLYTGGTPNMSAIGLALDVKDEAFILMNTADMIIGGIWMIVLLTVAKKIFGYVLPITDTNSISDDDLKIKALEGPTLKSIGTSIGITLLILGLCVGISLLSFGTMNEIFIILGVTTLSLVASLNSSIRTIKGSFLVGEYFVLLFCIGLGSMSNFESLLDSGTLYIGFVTIVMFTGIFIHLLLCKLFKIDVDTFLITSTACLYGPAFVGPIAKAINNKKAILSGMTAGTLGYAIANYWGIIIGKALSLWIIYL
ncbi:DUF819 family protein [Flammeovirga pectinis]|uniref:DUF819 family protein n=1 Tax=Flammeovirga pectinis TaxID=2494373 RepID=A0A3S9P000_9BACT|nr:DUF819 family protein [Flammeovirga pectinis]AZQ61496.1 DUF819 family protein [Flammeovirga pectinis]